MSSVGGASSKYAAVETGREGQSFLSSAVKRWSTGEGRDLAVASLTCRVVLLRFASSLGASMTRQIS